jgi:hypothetical protein
MSAPKEAVRWNGGTLDRHRHICVLYHNEDEEYQVLRPFIAEGFQRGDKAFHIIDEQRRQAHLRNLQDIGIDVEATEKTGQLEVRDWKQAHLRPGWFDQHAMLALVEEVLRDSKGRGFPFTRWVANMGWALGGHRGVHDLVEYCVRLNHVVLQFDAAVVCTYDLTRFSAVQVVEVLRSHPVAVIGGILQENPYYVPSEQMLEELARRPRTLAGTR